MHMGCLCACTVRPQSGFWRPVRLLFYVHWCVTWRCLQTEQWGMCAII